MRCPVCEEGFLTEKSKTMTFDSFYRKLVEVEIAYYSCSVCGGHIVDGPLSVKNKNRVIAARAGVRL